MKIVTRERTRKHTTAEIKWAGLMAKALAGKLKEPVHVVLYNGPEGFPTVELRTEKASATYHAGYIGDLADPDTRKTRGSLILRDLTKVKK